MDPRHSPAAMREAYRLYAAARPDLGGILLPGLLPHDACDAASRRSGRVKVLFVAESPPWAAGRHEIAEPADCRSPGYPYFWNDRYDAPCRPGAAPLSRGLAENLFRLLGLDGSSRRENLDLFTERGLFLVDTVRCVFRKNRKPAIPADLVRMSAQKTLVPELAALAPEYVVALGNTALTGLRCIEPYASALCGAGTITGLSREAIFEESRLLCLPYPGGRNRRYLDAIESGFDILRNLSG
ncbi:MAG: uracil-DNA glycosylase family protein [Methanoculleus horonobensis]|nr:uracil-DNA glycosylase family protein [Methanoculleus horonobensis]